MDEVDRICDEVIFLDHGRIVAQDTPDGLTRRITAAPAGPRARRRSASGRSIQALQPDFKDVVLADGNVVVVTTEEHQVPRAIFDIGNTGVQVLDIDIRKPTLEDVFLQIARAVANGALRRRSAVRSPERVRAVLLQEAFITGRSVEVLVDLPFWSLMTVVVFGFVTKFLSTVMDPTIAQYLYHGHADVGDHAHHAVLDVARRAVERVVAQLLQHVHCAAVDAGVRAWRR